MEPGLKRRGNCTTPASSWTGTWRLQFPFHQYQFLCLTGSCDSAHLIWMSHEIRMLFWGIFSYRRVDLTCWATPSKHFEHLWVSRESISSAPRILRLQWVWSMTVYPESEITVSGKSSTRNVCQQTKLPVFSHVRMGFILTDTLVQPYQNLQCLFIKAEKGPPSYCDHTVVSSYQPSKTILLVNWPLNSMLWLSVFASLILA